MNQLTRERGLNPVSKLLSALICAMLLTAAQSVSADSPTFELSAAIATRIPKSLTMTEQDTVVSTDGKNLSIGSVDAVSRIVALPSDLREVYEAKRTTIDLKTDFIMRSDGKALIAPAFMLGQVTCPYFILDTTSGTTVSGTYDGLTRYYSRGGTTTLCHAGLATNPGTSQFALAPALSAKDVYLIGYDAARTTLTAPLSESEVALAGRLAYLSATILAALYDTSVNTLAPAQKFVLYNLANSQQTAIAVDPSAGALSLIKALDSHTLILNSSTYVPDYSSSKVLFDTNSQTFSGLRTAEKNLFNAPWVFRDQLLEDSLGQSPLFQQSSYNFCNGGNGGLNENTENTICVSSSAVNQPWVPLQCFFQRSSFNSSRIGQGLGTTSAGKLVFGSGNRLGMVTFPSATLDGLDNFCTQLVLQEGSSCQKYLKQGTDTSDVKFKRPGIKKSCSIKFQLLNGLSPAPKGSPVRLHSKSTGKPVPIATRKTDKDGFVTFRLNPEDLPFRNRTYATAIFTFKGDESLRSSEFRIPPR